MERVLDICDLEKPEGVIVSMGGQVPNNLAMKLHNEGVKIIGTSPVQIDNAESRHKFSQILDKLEIDQPDWTEVTTLAEAKKFSCKSWLSGFNKTKLCFKRCCNEYCFN